MTMEPRLDIIGAVLGDPSRARILCELMDGRAFTNKELACAAGVTAQTASVHLRHLESAGLTTSLRCGRNIYHRIAGEQVAEVLEHLASLSPTDHLKRAGKRFRGEADPLCARSCYNHIAGRLGVAMTERMLALGVLSQEARVVSVGPAAANFFGKLGIDIPVAGRRPVVKFCLDWTERKDHISGPLATSILERALDSGWLVRVSGGRALRITEAGRAVLRREFGLDGADICRPPSRS